MPRDVMESMLGNVGYSHLSQLMIWHELPSKLMLSSQHSDVSIRCSFPRLAARRPRPGQRRFTASLLPAISRELALIMVDFPAPLGPITATRPSADLQA